MTPRQRALRVAGGVVLMGLLVWWWSRETRPAGGALSALPVVEGAFYGYHHDPGDRFPDMLAHPLVRDVLSVWNPEQLDTWLKESARHADELAGVRELAWCYRPAAEGSPAVWAVSAWMGWRTGQVALLAPRMGVSVLGRTGDALVLDVGEGMVGLYEQGMLRVTSYPVTDSDAPSPAPPWSTKGAEDWLGYRGADRLAWTGWNLDRPSSFRVIRPTWDREPPVSGEALVLARWLGQLPSGVWLFPDMATAREMGEDWPDEAWGRQWQAWWPEGFGAGALVVGTGVHGGSQFMFPCPSVAAVYRLQDPATAIAHAEACMTGLNRFWDMGLLRTEVDHASARVVAWQGTRRGFLQFREEDRLAYAVTDEVLIIGSSLKVVRQLIASPWPQTERGDLPAWAQGLDSARGSWLWLDSPALGAAGTDLLAGLRVAHMLGGQGEAAPQLDAWERAIPQWMPWGEIRAGGTPWTLQATRINESDR